MKGKLISKTLAEAGLTPQEGIQVLYQGDIVQIANIQKNHWIYVKREGQSFDDVTLTSEELKILMVEYEDNLDKYVRDRDNLIVQAFSPHRVKYTLPLKLTDWQTVIDSGLVDSDKEVEWVNTREPAGSSNIVATLIPQQDDVEKLFEAWIESNPDIREHKPVTWGKLSFMAGHRAAFALELPVKFAEWMAINGIKVDSKKGDEITWMKYVEASHTDQGTTRDLFKYWFNNIYKPE